jgi:segregation and condensation protein A
MPTMSGSAGAAATDGFVVEVPLFSGPFRLLAELILDRRMDVCDVPVARITDQFVRRGREEALSWPLDEVTWFLAVCATMLELKVGRLLPTPPVETEADLIGAVSPDLLYARSLELAAFRRVADALDALLAQAALSVPRAASVPAEFANLYPDVLEGVDASRLAALAAVALTPPPTVDLSHVAPIRVSLADAMALVQERVSLTGAASFREILADEPERIHVVVRFLALLELHRQGKVELSQARLFGDIQVRWRGESNDPPEVETIGETP